MELNWPFLLYFCYWKKYGSRRWVSGTKEWILRAAVMLHTSDKPAWTCAELAHLWQILRWLHMVWNSTRSPCKLLQVLPEGFYVSHPAHTWHHGICWGEEQPKGEGRPADKQGWWHSKETMQCGLKRNSYLRYTSQTIYCVPLKGSHLLENILCRVFLNKTNFSLIFGKEEYHVYLLA